MSKELMSLITKQPQNNTIADAGQFIWKKKTRAQIHLYKKNKVTVPPPSLVSGPQK